MSRVPKSLDSTQSRDFATREGNERENRIILHSRWPSPRKRSASALPEVDCSRRKYKSKLASVRRGGYELRHQRRRLPSALSCLALVVVLLVASTAKPPPARQVQQPRQPHRPPSAPADRRTPSLSHRREKRQQRTFISRYYTCTCHISERRLKKCCCCCHRQLANTCDVFY